MRAFLFELRPALAIDERRNGIGEIARRISARRNPLRLDENRPGGAKTAQRVVEARGCRDQFSRRRAAQTAMMWPISQSSAPTIHRRRPRPIAAAIVPLMMTTERGAPAIRIGSVRDRRTGGWKPTAGSSFVRIRLALRRQN